MDIQLTQEIEMPKAYIVGQVEVNNMDRYKSEYGAFVPQTIEQYGGTYLVRGGEVTDVEGTLPFSRVIVMEFPDKAAALAWYNSPEYQAVIKGRHQNAESIMTIIEGIN
jgi:uncharacterized protein (DUF1330 family)